MVEQAQRETQLVQEHLETKLTRQQLEQEKAAIHLRALQAQVNPHFLFNSLNSLASLIEEDAERAERFIDELSQTHRYLLTANDEPLTTLAKELEIVQAYYYLLKTHFVNGLVLRIEIKVD